MPNEIIIERLMDMELKVSMLYRIYAEQFSEDSDFWNSMADDEIEHKEYINSNITKFNQMNIEDIDTIEAELTAIEIFLDEIIRRYNSEKADKLEAYEYAFKIECSALESHISKMSMSENEEEKRNGVCFDELYDRDIEHVCKVMQMLKKNYVGENNYETLIKIGMKHELIAKNIYLKFSSQFTNNRSASIFFKQMAFQEEEHYTDLEKIMEESGSEIKKEYVSVGNAISSYIELINIMYNQMKNIKSLSEAIDIAHQIENSEVNVIFKEVINKFIGSLDRKKMILNQIREHNNSLITFSNFLK